MPVFPLLSFAQGIIVHTQRVFSDLIYKLTFSASDKGGKGMGRMPLKPVFSSFIVLNLMLRQNRAAI